MSIEEGLMRIARKFGLFVTLLVAATALVVSSASGQAEPLAHNQTPQLIVQAEVHDEADFSCPAVTPFPPPNPGPTGTSGGCRMHVVGTNIQFSEHLSAGGLEVPLSICTVEFDVRIDAAGEGYLSHHELTGDPAVCTKKACGQMTPPTAEGRAWSFFLQEAEPAPRERAVILFCLENRDGSGDASHCEVTLPVSQPTAHRYQFAATDTSGHGGTFPDCELDGTFNTEAGLEASCEGQVEQSVEIRHT
jgi:hypothetical protein